MQRDNPRKPDTGSIVAESLVCATAQAAWQESFRAGSVNPVRRLVTPETNFAPLPNVQADHPCWMSAPHSSEIFTPNNSKSDSQADAAFLIPR